MGSLEAVWSPLPPPSFSKPQSYEPLFTQANPRSRTCIPCFVSAPNTCMVLLLPLPEIPLGYSLYPTIQPFHYFPFQHCSANSQPEPLTPPTPICPQFTTLPQSSPFWSIFSSCIALLIHVTPPTYQASLCSLPHSYPSWRLTFPQHFRGIVMHSQLHREMAKQQCQAGKAAVPEQSRCPA